MVFIPIKNSGAAAAPPRVALSFAAAPRPCPPQRRMVLTPRGRHVTTESGDGARAHTQSAASVVRRYQAAARARDAEDGARLKTAVVKLRSSAAGQAGQRTDAGARVPDAALEEAERFFDSIRSTAVPPAVLESEAPSGMLGSVAEAVATNRAERDATPAVAATEKQRNEAREEQRKREEDRARAAADAARAAEEERQKEAEGRARAEAEAEAEAVRAAEEERRKEAEERARAAAEAEAARAAEERANVAAIPDFALEEADRFIQVPIPPRAVPARLEALVSGCFGPHKQACYTPE